MKPSELIINLRDRAILIVPSGEGKLRVEPASKLTADERAFIKGHVPTILAALALDSLLTADLDAEEEEQSRAAGALQDKNQRMIRQRRMDRLAILDEKTVRRLVEEGRMGVTDVTDWHDAVAALESRFKIHAMAAEVAGATGRQVTVVEGPPEWMRGQKE